MEGLIGQTHYISIFEAEYVLQLNKPLIAVRTEKYKPTGWLGMMIGTKLFYTCITMEDVDLCAQNVTKELGQCGMSAKSAGYPNLISLNHDINPVLRTVVSIVFMLCRN